METKLNETVNIQSGEVLPGVSLGAGVLLKRVMQPPWQPRVQMLWVPEVKIRQEPEVCPLGYFCNASAVPVGAKKAGCDRG